MRVICLLLIASLLSAMQISDIIKTIDKLNDLTAISSKLDYEVYDPFASAKPILKTKNISKKTLKHSNPIVIQTILNNRVFISGKWYNVGDKVRDFKIQNIRSDSIELSKDATIKIIRLDATKSILKTKGLKR